MMVPGEIYRVRDSQGSGRDGLAALKVEKEESVLKFESSVLKKLQGVGQKTACKEQVWS